MVNAIISNGWIVGEGSHGIVDVYKNGLLTKTMQKGEADFTFSVVVGDTVKVEVRNVDTLYKSKINGMSATSFEISITDSLLDTHFNITYGKDMLTIGIGVVAILGISYLMFRKKK